MGQIVTIAEAILRIVDLIRDALSRFIKAKKDAFREAGERLTRELENATTDEERARIVRELNKRPRA